MEADAINNAPQRQMPCTIMTGAVDSQSPDRSFAHANSTQSCRPREALLSSGPLCLKSGTPSCGGENIQGFRDKTVADAVAPRAAPEEPAEPSDIQLNSALRNTRAVIAENIEVALASDVSLAVVVMQG
jgi:hypothetical protein